MRCFRWLHPLQSEPGALFWGDVPGQGIADAPNRPVRIVTSHAQFLSVPNDTMLVVGVDMLPEADALSAANQTPAKIRAVQILVGVVDVFGNLLSTQSATEQALFLKGAGTARRYVVVPGYKVPRGTEPGRVTAMLMAAAFVDGSVWKLPPNYQGSPAPNSTPSSQPSPRVP